MTLTLDTITFRILMVAFKATLEFGYVYFVATVYAYAGFDFTFNLTTFLESWALYLCMILLLSHRLEKPSDFLIFLFFTTTITPMLSFYGLSEQSRIFTYCCVFVFILIALILRGPNLKIPNIKYGTNVMILLSLGVISLSLAQMVASGSIYRINFDLSKVYDFREEAGETLTVGIWAYIIPWTSKIFNIVLLANALLQKRYFIALCLIAFQVFLFGVTAHKGVALYPVFAIGLYLFRNSKHIILYLLISLIVFLLLGMATYFVFESKLLPSLFIRRVFFVPALLKYQYYDFFSTNEYVYWSNSIFSSFIDYPYHLKTVNLIGSVYYGNADMGANTGFLATSFMHFGYFGMLILGAVVAFLLKIADAFSNGAKPAWFYLSFLSVPFFGLFTNAALLTSLLTHGLGVAFLLAWLSYNKKIKI